MELAAVKEYLDEHYTEKLTLDDLAEKFFINKFYLSKIFKETYGTTVNNYLISKRITRAKQLLRFTDMTVDEIGVGVGMGDATTLAGCSARWKVSVQGSTESNGEHRGFPKNI